jgi:ubiquitin-like protein Pup
MPDQTRKPKPKKEDEEKKVEEEATAESKTSEIDELLDEIDEVLELNSEEFVRSYIQKGGEALAPIGFLSISDDPLSIALVLIAVLIYAVRKWKIA